ncbi:MAG: peptidoglycan-binding protein, partial [Clostridia bacterium]|nr:peptidoglycan-binding protein [Clostridia bacterium]
MRKTIKRMKKSLCIFLSMIIMTSMIAIGGFSASAASASGLASWAMNAYYSGWAYVWGGSSPGGVDCSGLIYSYVGGGARTSEAMIGASPRTGSISSIPEIPGLGLYSPGHVGVYVGGGMAVDARGTGYGVCYDPVSYMNWTQWFYVPGVDYGSGGGSVAPAPKPAPASSQQTQPQTSTQQNSTAAPAQNNNNNAGSTQNNNNNTGSTQQNSSTASNAVEVLPAKEYVQVGSTGVEVQSLQTRLGELRFYQGTDSGYFGTETEQALKNFQATAGLDATGILDDDTLYMLSLDSAPVYCPPVFHVGMSYTEIGQFKTKLSQLEYLQNGDTSNVFDEPTKEAVKLFQKAMDLPQTGEVDEATLAAIYSENCEANPYVPELQAGATGENVMNLQTRLTSLRYILDEDQEYDPEGVFGDGTVE